MPAPHTSGWRRFGVFEVDLASGELRKQGIKIKLYDQPFQVLAELLERPGEVVTREHLCQKLWPAGTFVDSEVGLNSAVKKLRDALGDSAGNPRFVETLPRRGYRLIVEVKEGRSDPSQISATPEALSPPAISTDRVREETTRAVPGSIHSSSSRRSFPFSLRRAILSLVTLLLIAIAGWWIARPKPHAYTIVVLPLKNFSAEPGTDYFSDGLTEGIMQNLSVIDGLEVRSRTSSFALKGEALDVHQLGSRLNANFIVDGSMSRAGNKLRVNAQLIRVEDDRAIWSNTYDREIKDVFAIQDEISRSIVNELRLRLGRGQRRYTTDIAAYDDYLKGLTRLHATPGSEAETIESSIPFFEAVVRRDPSFAPAYAGIGLAYAYMSATPRSFSPIEAYPKIVEPCVKALQLDPLLPEANVCLGLIHARDHAWEEGEKSFRRALDVNPNLAEAHQDLAVWILSPTGRLEEAVRELKTAIVLDPLSTSAKNLLSFVLVIAGRYDEVLESRRQALGFDPKKINADQLFGRALVQLGRTAEGITALQNAGFGSEAFLGYAYAKGGDREAAEKIAAEHRDLPWMQAIIYAGLGDSERSCTGLAAMVESRDPRAANYLEFPEMSALRSNPCLAGIRKSLNLPANSR